MTKAQAPHVLVDREPTQRVTGRSRVRRDRLFPRVLRRAEGTALTYPINFLWTVPRSVSTSFERMMSERGDHSVFDEPFSRHYYFGPQRCSPRFSEQLPNSSPAELLDQIESAARERPVFVKDMAYQAAGLLEPEILSRFRNSFLVRDPAATLRSLAGHWPDFTGEDETPRSPT